MRDFTTSNLANTCGATNRPTRVAFVLASNSRSPLPSTRIAVLNMLPFLGAAGFEPEIVFEPEQPNMSPIVDGLEHRLVAEGFGIVFLQKVRGPSVERLARRLAEHGIATVFGVCDLVAPAMVECTDATVAVTDYLKALYPLQLQPRIHVVHDGIENPFVRKLAYGAARGSRGNPLRAVLVTSSRLSELPVIGTPPEWLDVTIVGPYWRTDTPLRRLSEAGQHWREQPTSRRLHRLRFLMSQRIRRVPWHPGRVYEFMEVADVGIIPVEPSMDAPEEPVPTWQVKSENRLTMKMSVGLPVVASPVPAYTPVIEPGGFNGYIARTRRDWLDHLGELRDPARRKQVGRRARAAVLERYSMKEQARRLVAVLDSVSA